MRAVSSFYLQGLILAILLFGQSPGMVRSAQALGLEKVESLTPLGSESSFLSPSGLWYDGQRDQLIVADTENNKVMLLDRQGNLLKILGLRGQLSWPLATTTTRAAKLFIAERDRSVLKVAADYNSLTTEDYQLFDLSSFAQNRPVQPGALFSAADGSLYVCDRGNRQLLVFDRDRKLRLTIPKVGEPADVWVKDSKIYLADSGFGGVRVYNLQGQWLRTLGDAGADFPAPLRPKAITVDRRDRLWVLDESGTIYALDSLGHPRLTWSSTELFIPVDLALDNYNNLYVLERGGKRITVFRINEF